jgi:hypothetical protein
MGVGRVVVVVEWRWQGQSECGGGGKGGGVAVDWWWCDWWIPPTIQFSIDCLPWLYCTTSLNLYLPMDSYNLKPTNCCIPIFTYKFTYLRIATLYLRIHLLIPTNFCIPIWTMLYL